MEFQDAEQTTENLHGIFESYKKSVCIITSSALLFNVMTGFLSLGWYGRWPINLGNDLYVTSTEQLRAADPINSMWNKNSMLMVQSIQEIRRRFFDDLIESE